MWFFFVFLGLYLLAGVFAIVNNCPSTYDRSWSVGAMIDPSRR